MDWSRIEALIERYYEGETTLAEEQEIRQATKRVDCPAHLKAEVEMMLFFEREAEIESDTLQVELPQAPKKKGRLISLLAPMSGIAATVAVVGWFFFNQVPPTCNDNKPVLAVINNQKICDEQIAREEAKKALQLVAQQLNQGTSKLDYIETLNKPNQIVNNIKK